MRCPSCDHDNSSERRFCGECGVALAAMCAACGASNGPSEKFCGGCGARLQSSPTAPPSVALAPDATRPTGERRQLTVLFCDLVGSTPLSQQLDAEEWRDVVEAYHRTAAAAVTRFGGHVARYLGDGLLVYFGWPRAHEDDPERAIRAGLAILDAMVSLNATLAADTQLAVRIGMHTGPVVIGEAGEVFGDTPNVAARVQAAAEPNSVAITAVTQRLVAGMFVVEDRGPQALKGVREPVTLYRVVQPSGVRSRLAVAAGRLTPFVGREVELATLVDRWERAQDGEGQNVVLLGEAGVGKSRLVYQLHRHLAAVPHTWLECSATPYTGGTPFHPIIALVAQGLGFTPEDTPTDQFAKIERGLGRLASTEAVALLADFLGLPSLPKLQLSPELQRRKTIDLLVQWNLTLSTRQPLVLVVEDLQWCDASTLELLGHLIAQSPTARVLLLATARPEFTPPWPARSNVSTVQLARLTRRQARNMIATLAGTDLPVATLDALVTRADGVPLYLEELTKAMATPGAARSVDAIPASLADSLMARLDRLSTAKEVAQHAAVLGREFSHKLLASVVGMDEAALRHGLARLVEAEILFARGEPPDALYTFKHALVQEAAYGSLLKRTRRQLHGRVLDVLVKCFPERLESEPEVAARHAEAAGRIDVAIMYQARAGERAQARSAHQEAIDGFRKAIDLLATLPPRVERDAHQLTLVLALAASLTDARGYAHAETEMAYVQARLLAETVGDASRIGMAQLGLAMVYFNRGEIERGRALAADVLAAAEARGDVEQTLHAHQHVAIPELYQGRFRSSLEHSESALALYDPEQHHRAASVVGADEGVAALNYAAWNWWLLGYPDRALTRVQDAKSLAAQLAHPFSSAAALFFETVIHWLRRDAVLQRERAAEVIALSEAQGFPLWRGVGRAFHAAARVSDGDLGALSDIMEGFALSAETGNRSGVPVMLQLLAEAQETAGEFADAQRTVSTGLAIAAQSGQPFFDADLHRLQGDLILASGGVPADAETSFRHALSIARTQEAKSFELRAVTSLARLWQRQGKRDAARALLAPVCAWFTEGFDTRDLKDAKALLDELA